jgi:serine/threonine-protein kinase
MELIGRRFGHIRVTDVIGQGGMGDVYAGFDETLERKVALKVLNADQRLDEEARERLLREARALSKLEHPNICRIHDYIESEDVDLLVLEYIDGRTLYEAQAESLPRGEKLRIAIAIAEVLIVAHRGGILHRDLKPENVMLTKAGEIKVLDFGLARWLHRARARSSGRVSVARLEVLSPGTEPHAVVESAAETIVLPVAAEAPESRRRNFVNTAAGITLGTPLYMSPEQARGETLTPASDLFSFGLLLQTLFTGKEPHPYDVSAREAIQRVARGETLPAEGASGDITAIINALKRFAPADRPTAIDALEMLRFLASRPQRLARRGIAAAMALVLLAGGWRYTVDLRAQRVIAETKTADAQARRAEVEDLLEFMLGDLRKKLEPVGRLDILDDVGTRALLYVGALDPRNMSIGELMRNAKALNQLGEVRIAQGRLPEAIEIFGKAMHLADAAARQDTSTADVLFTLGQTNFWMGNAYRLKGEGKLALSYMRAYLAAGEKLFARDPYNEKYQMEVAFGHSAVATILEQQNDLRPALGHYRLTMQLKQALHRAKPDDPERRDELARTLNKVGFVLQRLGDFAGARAHFTSELAIRQQLVNSDHRQMPWKKELATSHSYVAGLLSAQGDDTAALLHRQAQLALEDELRRYDPQNVGWRRNYAITLMWIGILTFRRGDVSEAAAKLDAAREILLQIVRDEPQRPSWRRDLAVVESKRGSVLLASGNVPAATVMFDGAITTLEGDPSAQAKIALADSLLARAELPGAAAADRQRAYEVLSPMAEGTSDARILDAWARALSVNARHDRACQVRASLEHIGYRDHEFEQFFAKRPCR